jgi:hypothetical protein
VNEWGLVRGASSELLDCHPSSSSSSPSRQVMDHSQPNHASYYVGLPRVVARQHGYAGAKAGPLLPTGGVYHCATKEIRATTLTVAELPLVILRLVRATVVCPCGLQAPISLRRTFAEDSFWYACAILDAHMSLGPICKSRLQLDCGFRIVLLG